MSGTDPTQPTQKEAFFFLSILSNQKTKPDVDWNVVAQKNGYSNANCAKVRFGQIKRRLGYTDDGMGPANASAAPKKNGHGGRKAQPKKAGSGTNGNASKVKKSPSKARGNGKVSKADFAEAAIKYAKDEDDFSIKMPVGREYPMDDDETSGDYDDNGHSDNFESGSHMADDEGEVEGEDHFYDAQDAEQEEDKQYV